MYFPSYPVFLYTENRKYVYTSVYFMHYKGGKKKEKKYDKYIK